MSGVAAVLPQGPELPDIRGVDVAGRTVLVRAEFGGPQAQGSAGDPARVRQFAPTVADLLSRGASIVVMSHLGRPGGVANPTLTLAPIAAQLAHDLGRNVTFVPECVGAVAEQVTRTLPPGSVAVLENLRFHEEEEANDRSFALLLSVHGDIYVNDMPSFARGTRGRRQASIHALPALMPAYAGPLLVAARKTGWAPENLTDTLEETRWPASR